MQLSGKRGKSLLIWIFLNCSEISFLVNLTPVNKLKRSKLSYLHIDIIF